MKWFRKAAEKEVTAKPAAYEPPRAERDAVVEIRASCIEAADSAIVVGVRYEADDPAALEHAARYETTKRKALELTLMLTDQTMRDVAMFWALDLCAKAQDYNVVKLLLNAIKSPTVLEKINFEHPEIRQKLAARSR